jgi:glyoxylase-like metal-dependent hydrolase (beta-lactamase superfamily II)
LVLKVSQFGEVTRFDLARPVVGLRTYWTTAYLVDGLLVDSGCAHCASEMATILAERKISKIANTHSHEDHIGANGLLQRHDPGLSILAHPLALPILADPRRTQPLQPYRRLYWGWPEASHGMPLVDGEMIETEHCCFEVLYTPGHSPDHICLYERQRKWLFSGDLYVGGKERALRAGYDIWGIIASLKQVAELPIDWLFAGSARVRENPGAELQAKIEHLEILGQQVLEMHAQGHHISQIVSALCGESMLIELITLGHFSRRHLVESYLGVNTDD